jgi:hypothetical protein
MTASLMDPLSVRIAEALRQEQMRQALEQAAADIDHRIDTGEVPGFIEIFLEARWQSVLALAHSSGDPQELAAARQTMDDLIWSVQPKDNAAQCKVLLGRLSAILGAVNAGLNAIHWNSPARAVFFSQLAQRHSLTVRHPLSARRRVEVAVNAAQKASERRWSKDSRAQQLSDDMHIQSVHGLQIADWLVFRRDSDLFRRYKVAWISPMRSMFIFIDPDGQDFFALSADDLVQNFRDQSVRVAAAPN